jgi:hypothetical protein
MSLTNHLALLPHYMTAATTYAEILASPLPRLQKHTDISTQDFAHYPDLCQHPWVANYTQTSNWWLCGITAPISKQLVKHMCTAHLVIKVNTDIRKRWLASWILQLLYPTVPTREDGWFWDWPEKNVSATEGTEPQSSSLSQSLYWLSYYGLNLNKMKL